MLLDLAALQREAEARYELPAGLLAAVMKVESGGRPDARSPAGALGLYQFMPGTAKGLGIDPLDPQQSTLGAARYLDQLRDQFGDWRSALAAYNWGPGNVARKGLEAAPGETRAYVPKVLGQLGAPQRDWQDIAIERTRTEPEPFKAWRAQYQERERKGMYGYPGAEADASADHYLFARSKAAENPLNVAWLWGAPYGYALQKRMGFKPKATPASWEQVMAGLMGMYSGLTGGP
jgi:hypothetical protein